MVLPGILLGRHPLPTSVLTSTKYYAGESVMAGTPALFVTKLLLQKERFFIQFSKEPVFAVVCSELVRKSLYVPMSAIEYISKVMLILDTLAIEPEACSLEGHRLVFEVWAIMASKLRDFLKRGGALYGTTHDLSWLYSVLLFPIRHHLDDPYGGNAADAKLFMELVNQVHESGKKATWLERNEICESLSSRLTQFLEEHPDKVIVVSITMATIVRAALGAMESLASEENEGLSSIAGLDRTMELMRKVVDVFKTMTSPVPKRSVADSICQASLSIARVWPDTDFLFMKLMGVASALMTFQETQNPSFDQLLRPLCKQIWKKFMVKRRFHRALSPGVGGAVDELVIMVKRLKAKEKFGELNGTYPDFESMSESPLQFGQQYIMLAPQKGIVNPNGVRRMQLSRPAPQGSFREVHRLAAVRPYAVAPRRPPADEFVEPPAAPVDDAEEVVCLTPDDSSPSGVRDDVPALAPPGPPVVEPVPEASRSALGSSRQTPFGTAPSVVRHGPLTKHQREVMKKRRDDIPALYGDLTQDTQTYTQFEESNSTQDTSAPQRFQKNFASGSNGVPDHAQDSNAAQEPFKSTVVNQQINLDRPFSGLVQSPPTAPTKIKENIIFNSSKVEKLSPIQMKRIHPYFATNTVSQPTARNTGNVARVNGHVMVAPKSTFNITCKMRNPSSNRVPPGTSDETDCTDLTYSSDESTEDHDKKVVDRGPAKPAAEVETGILDGQHPTLKLAEHFIMFKSGFSDSTVEAGSSNGIDVNPDVRARNGTDSKSTANDDKEGNGLNVSTGDEGRVLAIVPCIQEGTQSITATNVKSGDSNHTLNAKKGMDSNCVVSNSRGSVGNSTNVNPVETVTNATDLKSALIVNKGTNFNSTASIGKGTDSKSAIRKGANVNSTASAAKQSDLDSAGAVKNGTEVNSMPCVAIQTDLKPPASVAKQTDLKSTSSVAKQTDLKSPTSVTKQPVLKSTASVAKQINLKSTCGIKNDTNLNSTVGVAKHTDLKSTTSVAKQTDLKSTDSVAQEIDLKTTCDDKNRTNLNSTTSVAKQTGLKSTTSVAKQTDLTTTCGVKNDTDLNSTASVAKQTDWNVEGRVKKETDSSLTTNDSKDVPENLHVIQRKFSDNSNFNEEVQSDNRKSVSAVPVPAKRITEETVLESVRVVNLRNTVKIASSQRIGAVSKVLCSPKKADSSLPSNHVSDSQDVIDSSQESVKSANVVVQDAVDDRQGSKCAATLADCSQDSIRSVKLTLQKLPDIPPGFNAVITKEDFVSRGPEPSSPILVLKHSTNSVQENTTVRKRLRLDASPELSQAVVTRATLSADPTPAKVREAPTTPSTSGQANQTSSLRSDTVRLSETGRRTKSIPSCRNKRVPVENPPGILSTPQDCDIPASMPVASREFVVRQKDATPEHTIDTHPDLPPRLSSKKRKLAETENITPVKDQVKSAKGVTRCKPKSLESVIPILAVAVQEETVTTECAKEVESPVPRCPGKCSTAAPVVVVYEEELTITKIAGDQNLYLARVDNCVPVSSRESAVEKVDDRTEMDVDDSASATHPKPRTDPVKSESSSTKAVDEEVQSEVKRARKTRNELSKLMIDCIPYSAPKTVLRRKRLADLEPTADVDPEESGARFRPRGKRTRRDEATTVQARGTEVRPVGRPRKSANMKPSPLDVVPNSSKAETMEDSSKENVSDRPKLSDENPTEPEIQKSPSKLALPNRPLDDYKMEVEDSKVVISEAKLLPGPTLTSSPTPRPCSPPMPILLPEDPPTPLSSRSLSEDNKDSSMKCKMLLSPHRTLTKCNGLRKNRHPNIESRSQLIVSLGQVERERIRAETQATTPEPDVDTEPTVTGAPEDYVDGEELTVDAHGRRVLRPWVRKDWSPILQPSRSILKIYSPRVSSEKKKRVYFPIEHAMSKRLSFFREEVDVSLVQVVVALDPPNVKVERASDPPGPDDDTTTPVAATSHDSRSTPEASCKPEEEPAQVAEDSQDSQMCTSPAPLELVRTELLNDSDPIFPLLLNCRHPVDNVINNMVSPYWTKGLMHKLKDDLIETVGDFSMLTEKQVFRLPVKEPKIQVVTKALAKYHRLLEKEEEKALERLKHRPTALEKAMMRKTPEEIFEAIDNVPQGSLFFEYLCGRMKRSQKIDSVDLPYLIKHILKRCDTKEVFDALEASCLRKNPECTELMDAAMMFVTKSDDRLRDVLALGIETVGAVELVNVLLKTEKPYLVKVVSLLVQNQPCENVLVELKGTKDFDEVGTKFIVTNVGVEQILAELYKLGSLRSVNATSVCSHLDQQGVLSYVVEKSKSEDVINRMEEVGKLKTVETEFMCSKLSQQELRSYIVTKQNPEDILNELEATGRLKEIGTGVVCDKLPQGELLAHVVDRGDCSDIVNRLQKSGRLEDAKVCEYVCDKLPQESLVTSLVSRIETSGELLRVATKLVGDRLPRSELLACVVEREDGKEVVDRLEAAGKLTADVVGHVFDRALSSAVCADRSPAAIGSDLYRAVIGYKPNLSKSDLWTVMSQFMLDANSAAGTSSTSCADGKNT